MTGPQLRTWRKAEGYSMQELVASHLGNQVSQATVSRWESSPGLIPSWASQALLTKTRVELPLDELQQLLDYARLHNLNFRQLIARAVHQLLTTEPTNTTTEAHFTTRTQPPMPEDNRLNDPPKLYTTD